MKTSNLNKPFPRILENLPVHDILYMEGAENYTIIHLTNGRKMMSSRTLEFNRQCLADDTMLRVHKSFCVNSSYVKSYDLPYATQVELCNGKVLQISRRRRTEVKRYLGNIA